MEQQHWQDPASPASTAPAPPARLEHGGPDTREAWAATSWAVVTATGIVQARCGQPTSPGACGAWRLSAPGGKRPVPLVQAAQQQPLGVDRPFRAQQPVNHLSAGEVERDDQGGHGGSDRGHSGQGQPEGADAGGGWPCDHDQRPVLAGRR
jgi:hypothetical protein